MLEFIIKSTISSAVLYSIYFLLLRNLKTYHFNRFYLLITLIFAIVVPFIKIRFGSILPDYSGIPDISDTPALFLLGENQPENPVRVLTFKHLLITVYLLISFIMLVRFAINLYRIFKKIIYCQRIRLYGSTLLLVDENTSPYSFLGHIFVNRYDYECNRIENELVIHESAHCRQWHTADIIIAEVVKIVLWFNPFVWLIKSAMKLNHEFLSDSFVLESSHIADYQNKLLNIVFRNNSIYLASNFNYSFIKKRLIMMAKINSPRKSIPAKIAVIAVFLSLAYALTYSQEKRHVMDDIHFKNEWWYPILKKHKIEPHAFNNFDRIFEMGTKNSINDRVVTLEEAFFLIKTDDKNYLIIKSPLAYHNLESNIIEAATGTVESFSFKSKELKPINTINFENLRYQQGVKPSFKADKMEVSD